MPKAFRLLEVAVLLLAFTAGAFFSGCGEDASARLAAPPGRINVLLITIDTLRADYLGCYGNQEVRTPQIDRLAAEGARFAFCVAHNPTTLPSHVNILTGTDARVHGVHDNYGFRLGSEAVTMAETMKAAGYHTAAFIGAFVLDRRFGLDQGFDCYDDNLEAGSAVLLMGVERRADAVVAGALNWIGDHKGEPWFAWVHIYDPHAPYRPPAPFDAEFASNPYAGEVSYADAELGKLFDYLRSEDLLDSTLLVLTSDHGEGLGDHGELTHGVFAYNTTIHVPLIIRAPWLARPGTEIERRVRHIDLLPTIVESVGGTLPEDAHGESLLPLLPGDGDGPTPDSYFEALGASFARGWAPLRGLYSENWKYIELPLPELYDVEGDPNEARNLVESRAGTSNRLRTILKSITQGTENAVDAHIREDEETRGRLMALGYLSGSPQPPKEQYGPADDPKNLIDIDARIESAAAATSSGDLNLAVKILQELIAEQPEMAISYQLLANLLVELGRQDEAVSYLERAAEKGLGGEAVLTQLAIVLLRAGESGRAVPMLEELVNRNPDDLDTANVLASWLTREGDPAKAEDLYTRMIGRDPAYVKARNGFGWLLARQGRHEDAIEQFNAALHYQPTSFLALHGRGVVYEMAGMLEEAEESFRAVLAVNEHYLIARLRLGMVLLHQERYGEAERELRRFLAGAGGPEFEEARAEAQWALEQILQAAGRRE